MSLPKIYGRARWSTAPREQSTTCSRRRRTRLHPLSIDALTTWVRERFFGGGQDVYSVDREDLLRRVQSGEAVVIDVRPSNEYDTAHIAGAISIPLQQLEELLGELPRDKNIVAYCRGPYCVFADQAVGILRNAGYKALRLNGGFPEWQMKGMPVERNAVEM